MRHGRPHERRWVFCPCRANSGTNPHPKRHRRDGQSQRPRCQEYASNDPEIVKAMIAREPIGRFGEPEEIASAVVWLCTPAASFMVGHAMAVDGGVLAQ